MLHESYLWLVFIINLRFVDYCFKIRTRS